VKNNKKNKHNREALYLAHQYANEFFKNELKNSDEGKSIGLSYFKKRGYNFKTIEDFELGYSPEKIDAISKKALEDKYNLESLFKCGIIKKNEKGTYDFFRGRVIFPIHNISGRIIGSC
jgi:DNA primase